MKFKVAKAASMLKDFFGLHPGQTSSEFVKEKNALSDDDKIEVTDLVAAEFVSDPEKAKKYGIESIA